MAGDWMKIDLSLPDKPEVWQMAGLLSADSDLIVGKLVKVWRWFDQHTEDGVTNLNTSFVDSVAGFPGFADAMIFVGWLEQRSPGLCLPSFDKHNGKTAKYRADTARRVAKSKAKKAEGNEPVTRNPLPRPVVSAVRARDSSTCVYCGRPEGQYAPPETSRDAVLCIDHVIPLAQGGSDSLENLVCACSVCNLFKSDRTPDECGLPWPVDAGGNKFGNRISVTSALPREEKRREEQDQKLEADASSSPTKKAADCPHQSIIELYHEILPANPRMKVWSDKRARSLATRWREDPKRQSLDYWRRFFGHVAASAFLTGRTPGDRPFLPGLDWMVQPENFAKIIEGRYNGRGDA